jgi:hypothetical protein
METVALTVHESEINKLKAENLELRERLMDMSTAGMAEQSADLNFQLKMARQLIASKAFPNMTPEQAFVILQAGKEMGMQPMESIKKLYIVNGAVGFHGSGLVEQITKAGAFIDYLDETDNSVTVVVTYNGKEYIEKVSDKDQTLAKSKAMTFAKKTKMRYHGIRLILNTRLPHLAGSVSVWDADDYEAAANRQKPDFVDTLTERINQCQNVVELEALHKEEKGKITKSLDLLNVFGKRKRELSNETN